MAELHVTKIGKAEWTPKPMKVTPIPVHGRSLRSRGQRRNACVICDMVTPFFDIQAKTYTGVR